MKHARIHVRIDDAMKARLAAAVRKINMPGVDEAAIVRGCLNAFVETVEEHGGIFIPIALKPREEGSKSQALPAKSGRSDAPNALPANPSTDSTRCSVNEEPVPRKPASPRLRSTRAGVRKTVASSPPKP